MLCIRGEGGWWLKTILTLSYTLYSGGGWMVVDNNTNTVIYYVFGGRVDGG